MTYMPFLCVQINNVEPQPNCALIGLIWILPFSVILHGVWNLPLTGVIVDSAWHVIEEGLVGIAIALVYGKPGAVELT